MKPACSDLEVKTRLGLSWRNLRRLREVAPWPDAPINSLEFEQWATKRFAGDLICYQRLSHGPQYPKVKTDVISINEALFKLKMNSPAYQDYLLGCDAEGVYSLVGARCIVLGRLPEAYKWLKAKANQQKAA